MCLMMSWLKLFNQPIMYAPKMTLIINPVENQCSAIDLLSSICHTPQPHESAKVLHTDENTSLDLVDITSLDLGNIDSAVSSIFSIPTAAIRSAAKLNKSNPSGSRLLIYDEKINNKS
ncbi:hypothetical protein LSH36_983g00026 [Paralvinella palmiformis]|uniref:Uncharacterized protein n=1 Tax=Paralvinella palmiformis TaxID=53620 RepID=A0AAD9IX01_9ANNE|nr:hypothetical protein LSH36_983g00026 [Paralvinella palmiformis]